MRQLAQDCAKLTQINANETQKEKEKNSQNLPKVG
jgi:hypothetical protein